MALNKVFLIGNLGRDPELKTFGNGGKVCNVSIATTERWKDKQSGEQKEATEWHNLVFSDRLADIAAQYLRKGSQIHVEGKIKTRKWQDQQGNDRYTTEIQVREMQMLGGKPQDGGGQQAQQPRQQPAPHQQGGGFDDDLGDVPF